MSRVVNILLMVTLSVLAVRANADSPRPHSSMAPAPLAAEQLQMVRGVSRSVLGARRLTAEDADIVAMSQSVRALRAAVDASLSVHAGVNAASIVPNQSGSKDGRGKAGDLASRDADNRVRTRLSDLKARRLNLQNRAAKQTDKLVSARMKSLSSTASNLEAETEHALSTTDHERFERLAKLRERLKPETLGERIHKGLSDAGEPPQAPTPTISTITEHR